MHEVRNQNERAEQLFLAGLELYPGSVRLLGHYALFILNKRRNVELAGNLYRQAVTAQPNDAEALGNLAWFLASDYTQGLK